jgi:hypothetical protein
MYFKFSDKERFYRKGLYCPPKKSWRNQIMENVQQKTYSIGEAARICGVTEKQIRHWEEKNHIPKAQRVICGERSYRQFTETDFNLIRKIREYLDEGYTLSTAAKKAAEEISTRKEEV